jgi:hypothetical protein
MLQAYSDQMTSIYLELLDDIVLDIAFEMHRKLKLGLLCLNCDSVYSDVIHKSGCDIFGQTATEISSSDSFECVNCKRLVVASRYAPHLEKCMGFGRNASRNASRKLANAAKADEYQEILLKHLEEEHQQKYYGMDDAVTLDADGNIVSSIPSVGIFFIWEFFKEFSKKKKRKRRKKKLKEKKKKIKTDVPVPAIIEVPLPQSKINRKLAGG